jgi:hypothetical protein
MENATDFSPLKLRLEQYSDPPSETCLLFITDVMHFHAERQLQDVPAFDLAWKGNRD